MSHEFSDLPALKGIIKLFDLNPDKSLGQHFLLDPELLASICVAAGPLDECNVVEIGPGPGGLTRALLDIPVKHITAIEFDPRAVKATEFIAAKSNGRLSVYHADALKINLPDITDAPRAIVANLPYNIGTALLIKWLAEADQYRSMTLMFQKEVAERICAAPGSQGYGRLSVISQWLCSVQIMFEVRASAFAPPPKVDSAIVKLIPKTTQPSKRDFTAMGKLTALAFGQRRKMLRGSLKSIGGTDLLNAVGIAPERRAETLSVAEFEALMRESLRLTE